MPSATIIPFATRPQGSRFTVSDRMELQQLGGLLRERGLARMVVHERVAADPPELGNYLALYAAGETLASWGLMRRDDGIVLWHCGTGLDRGCFACIRDALLSLPRAGRERCGAAAGGALCAAEA